MKWIVGCLGVLACAPVESVLAPVPIEAEVPEPRPKPIVFGEWDVMSPPPCARIADFDVIVAESQIGSLALQDLSTSRAQLAGLLEDEFRTERLLQLRAAPEEAGCLDANAGGLLDEIMLGHPAASAIRHAAELIGEPVSGEPYGRIAIDEALALLCAEARCGEPEGSLPPPLGEALAPVLLAIRDGLLARADRDAAAGRGPDWWRTYSGSGLIFDPEGQGYDRTDPVDRAYLEGGRAELYLAAARIAHAIESIDWTRFAGSSAHFELATEAGVIRVRGAADDRYLESVPTLLLVDLGGNDRHRDEVASNLSGANAVSIAIDVSGDDDYGFEDDDERFGGDDRFGPISLSTSFRQGAARNGIAMLFDLAGDDEYRSLRGSQGYAHQGIGVLFDRSGDDEYESEAVSQGAAQFGIGLLIDLAGDDEHRSVFGSQGFGFVGGVGIAFDGAGRDEWICEDEIELYRSPQLPGRNTSLCQGAGFGLRSDDPIEAMSGGLGLLRDREGDDRYSASVYAQGVGYWQGVGLLSDGGGDDRYDALYYAQGAGVHYAAGVLIDHAGDDRRGGSLVPENLSMGAGYDFSVGVLFDLGGDDDVRLRGLSVGSASGAGVGLYHDRSGDDVYRGGRTGRSSDRGRGLMIDRAGQDEYEDEDD